MTELSSTNEIEQGIELKVEQDGELDAEQVDDLVTDLDDELEAEQDVDHGLEIEITHVNAIEKSIAVSPVTKNASPPNKSQDEPTLVYAGNDIVLKVKVTCPAKCDLQGEKVVIKDQDDILLQLELTSFDGEVNETDAVVLKAPAEPGDYTWTAEFMPEYVPEEEQDTPHEHISTTFPFYVELHAIALSSWGAPFPVIAGSKFTLKAGVKCFAGCKLTGQTVEIYDSEGTKLAAGTLSEEPWQDTVATYWAELEFDAPSEEGVYEWELKFPKLDLEYSHEEASHTFVFRVTRQPDHYLTIEVISDIEKTPVVGALVTITLEGTTYRGWSDNAGIVKFNVPKGDYSLLITAEDHQDFEDNIAVESDQVKRIEIMYFFDSYK